ncbi:MAG: hypothetical protein NC124_13900 [Clostridium sp.]|nr:hypothetical protein [Clostridium sp.]
MTHIKEFLIIAILFLEVLICYGCGTTSQPEQSVNSKSNEQSGMFTYQISAKEFDREAVCDVLLEGYDTSKMPQEQENGSTIIDVGESSLLMGKGSLEYQKDNNAANIGSMLFYYVIPEVLDTAHDSESEADVLKEEAEVKEIESKVAGLCISEDNERLNLSRAVKMEKSELENILSELRKSGEYTDDITQWEAEEYIGLQYEMVKDDIPVMGLEEPNQGYKIDIWAAQPAYVQVLIGNGRILYMSARGLVQAGENEEVMVISKEEAVRAAEKETEDVLSDMDWKTEEVKLEYVSIPDWSVDFPQPKEMVPYWCIIKKNEGEEVYEAAVRINAVTGGNLAYGE